MATFIYDGKSNLTATATDTVVITADPTLFTQAFQNTGNVALQFGANTLTITGASLTSSGTGSLQNVSLAGGTFSVGVPGPGTTTLTTANSLIIGTDGVATNITTGTTSAESKNALFGGNGISGPNDGADSFAIGGKGSFLVYGNGGTDVITQNTAVFDSTSAVTVFGGKGGDSINLTTVTNNVANKGSLLILGGEDADTIKVLNTGTTTIFGGTGAGDSADGADSIGLLGSGGTITVYANGGADLINGDAIANGVGTGFLDGTKATIYGGAGNDTVNITFAQNAKGTVTVYGGEDADTIQVVNTGTTTIYGGTGQGDSTDGADNIILSGSSGTVTVFANAGNDFITGVAGSNSVSNFADGVNANLYGGKGNDTINVGIATGGKGTINVFGGEDQDSITVGLTAGSATTVYGGTGQGDSADGADLITITGQGTATVFGNGGADSINLAGFTGASSAASANVVTVYGGTGNDSINVGSTVNGTATFNLSGNEGNDTFIIGNVGATEVATVTFGSVAATKALTVAGLTITAGNTNAVTAAEISAAVAGQTDGATLNVTTASGGTITGTLTGYSTGAASNGTTVAFTSSTVETNVADLTATGTAAAPTISISQGVTSASTGTGVSILDFTVASDKLSIQNGVAGTSTPTITVTPSAGFTDLQSALNAASSATKGAVAVVAFGGSTYVVTSNDTTATFSAATDSAIKLTGVTDLNGVVNAITVL
jgi:hypothetical protein